MQILTAKQSRALGVEFFYRKKGQHGSNIKPEFFLFCLIVLCNVACDEPRAAHEPDNKAEIINSDFEEASQLGWSFAGGQGSGKIADRVGRNNSRGVILRLHQQQQFDAVSQRLTLPHSKEVSISAWVRTEGKDAHGFVSLECINPSLTLRKEDYGELACTNSQTVSGNTNWQRVSVRLKVPKAAQLKRLFGCARGTNGTVYFDDFEIRIEPK